MKILYDGMEKNVPGVKKSAPRHRYKNKRAKGGVVMKILITTDWYTPAVNGVVTSVKICGGSWKPGAMRCGS